MHEVRSWLNVSVFVLAIAVKYDSVRQRQHVDPHVSQVRRKRHQARIKDDLALARNRCGKFGKFIRMYREPLEASRLSAQRSSVVHPRDRSACSLAVPSISISAYFEISELASSPSNVSQLSSPFSCVLALASLSRPFPEFPSLLTHVHPRFSHSVAF